MGLNTIVMLGRFVAQPELKHTSSDIAVCSFTLAVQRPGAKDKTDFIDCVAWRNTAEFITKYFNKGSMIAVQGVLTSRMFEDKDGNKRKAYEVQVDNVSFTGSKSENEGGNSYPKTDFSVAEPQSFNQGNFAAVDFEEIGADGDLPF